MKFNLKPQEHNEEEKFAKIRDEVFGSLEFFYRTISNLEKIDGFTIKKLAVELGKLLTDKKKIGKEYLCLFDYVLSNPKFPVIYSIEDRLAENYLINNDFFQNELNLDFETYQQSITFATSLSNRNGIYAPIMKYQKFTTLEDWLKTNVLILSNENKENKFISVENIIKDIRNKEGAHIDIEFYDKQNQRYSLLNRLDERYEIIIGLTEIVLVVYESIIKRNPLRFKQIKLNDDECIIRYRYYKTDNPLILNHFCTFKANDLPGAFDISYELTREIKDNETVNIFGFGDTLSLKIDSDKNLYIDVFGEKNIITKVN